jgi:hypothetical protein
MQAYEQPQEVGTQRNDWPWRVAPLVSAGIVYAATSLNFVALLLAPLSLAVAVIAFRRIDGRAGVLLFLGLALNLFLNVWLVAIVAIIAYGYLAD